MFLSAQSGEIDVVNHTTGDRCHLKFAPYSYFSRDVARKVRKHHRVKLFASHPVWPIPSLLQPNNLWPVSSESYSSASSLQVTGVVMDKDGKAHYVLSGTWDEKMEFSRVMQSSRGGENGTEGKQKTVYQTLKAREVWRRNPLP